MTLILTDADEEDFVKWIKDNPALYEKIGKAYKDVKKKEVLWTGKAKDIGQESRFIFLLVFASFQALLLMYLPTNWPLELMLMYSYQAHSEKSPNRQMLFYSTNYWQQFWVQFVV